MSGELTCRYALHLLAAPPADPRNVIVLSLRCSRAHRTLTPLSTTVTVSHSRLLLRRSNFRTPEAAAAAERAAAFAALDAQAAHALDARDDRAAAARAADFARLDAQAAHALDARDDRDARAADTDVSALLSAKSNAIHRPRTRTRSRFGSMFVGLAASQPCERRPFEINRKRGPVATFRAWS